MSLRRKAHGHLEETSILSEEEYVSPTFILEHLATFSISSEHDILYPSDGMRRLLTMEQKNGIWTQRMLMKIERSTINIMDNESKEIVERFPIRLVRDPTAFTSNDPKEVYNNILIYIVGHTSLDDPASSPAEMHIFQCVNVQARDLVEVLKCCSSITKTSNSGQKLWQDLKVDNYIPAYEDVDSDSNRENKMTMNQFDVEDASSVFSDHFDEEVKVLNSCFDDIEKFVARLQHAAAAFRELEKRRRSRRSKRKDLGDGMLSVRAKPPSERDFVDVFQKFKLSFNLLARLKSHIHDPNAPELVHFLFTPLALIVDASHDSHYTPNLASKIVSPLLSADAVDLLENCLTSKESELWNMLGEAWIVPDGDWKGPVQPYQPVFSNNWAPKLMFLEKMTGGHGLDEQNYPDKEDKIEKKLQSDFETEALIHSSVSQTALNNPHFQAYRNTPDDDGIADDEDLSLPDSWAVNVIQCGGKIAQVSHPRTANNDKELSVNRGEFLEVLDDSRKWWRVQNSQGQVGHVPHTIVVLHASLPRNIQNHREAKKQSNKHWVRIEKDNKIKELRYF